MRKTVVKLKVPFLYLISLLLDRGPNKFLFRTMPWRLATKRSEISLHNHFAWTVTYHFGPQKWNLQKSACDDGVKIELRPVLAQFRANLSFPALKMLLSGL